MDSIHILFSEAEPQVMHDLCMAKSRNKSPSKPTDPVAIETGRRVKQCRKALNLTQKGLSKLTGYKERKEGLSPTQIANFEQGTRRIRFEEAEILASVFDQLLAGYFMNALTEQECRVLIAMRTKDNPLPKAG